MIYLIKSAAYKNKECTEYEDTLKIGYTKDDGRKSRFNCYITENPTCQILYLIPKGTEQDERNLHHYFKKYKKNYGQEWFSYEEEIINFFKTHTTKESLKELKTYKTWRQEAKLSRERNEMFPILSKKYISKVLSSLEVSDKYPETIDDLVNKLYELLEDNLDLSAVGDYFKTSYPEIDFTEETILSSEISKEINKIEKLSHFNNKISYIYSLQGKYSSNFMKLLLDNLTDLSFAKYYYSISNERASALKYQKGNLEKEYKSQKSLSLNIKSMVSEIISAFPVNNRFSKSYIKETLRTIYESNGYNKTPKASDLEEYFEIKLCKVLNESTGKRDMAFEIIKLKEETQCQ